MYQFMVIFNQPWEGTIKTSVSTSMYVDQSRWLVLLQTETAAEVADPDNDSYSPNVC